jgi:hypothetical protein
MKIITVCTALALLVPLAAQAQDSGTRITGVPVSPNGVHAGQYHYGFMMPDNQWYVFEYRDADGNTIPGVPNEVDIIDRAADFHRVVGFLTDYREVPFHNGVVGFNARDVDK